MGTTNTLKHMRRKRICYVVVAAILGICLIAAIAFAGGYLGDKYAEENIKITEDTLRSYVVQCYALEGQYPETLEYLTDNYTLTLNEDYVYHYEYIGANMMPEITVFAAK